MTQKFAIKLTNEELADLSNDWENPTVDTRKYYQNVFKALKVDQETYEYHKKSGGLCQVYENNYYIA